MKKGRSLGGAALAVLLLALLVLYALRFMLPAPAPEQAAAEPSPLPQETVPPPTAAPVPTAEPTPQPTPEPTPEPTPAPQARYVFHFAGDCTIGSLVEWQGSNSRDFQSVVGQDYAYPLPGARRLSVPGASFPGRRAFSRSPFPVCLRRGGGRGAPARFAHCRSDPPARP